MAFTTWAALKTAALDDIADLNITIKATEIKNRSTLFRDLARLEEWLKYIDKQILIEAGTRSIVRVGDISGA